MGLKKGKQIQRKKETMSDENQPKMTKNVLDVSNTTAKSINSGAPSKKQVKEKSRSLEKDQEIKKSRVNQNRKQRVSDSTPETSNAFKQGRGKENGDTEAKGKLNTPLSKTKQKSLKMNTEQEHTNQKVATERNSSEKHQSIAKSTDDGSNPQEDTPVAKLELKLTKDTEKRIKKRVKQIKVTGTSNNENRGVIYLGHIPFGFYEQQMKEYFSQFGQVTRLRHSRSIKTGRSRGFAFIEFANAEVANIVAETMNNYLLFGKLLRCHVVSPKNVHPQLFRTPKRVDVDKLARQRHNKPRTVAQYSALAEKRKKKNKRLQEKLNKLGIKYSVDSTISNVPFTKQQITNLQEDSTVAAMINESNTSKGIKLKASTSMQDVLNTPIVEHENKQEQIGNPGVEKKLNKTPSTTPHKNKKAKTPAKTPHQNREADATAPTTLMQLLLRPRLPRPPLTRTKRPKH
eukprot:gene7249-7657_t